MACAILSKISESSITLGANSVSPVEDSRTLTADTQAVVYHFGEMGNRWGFNRTVGQMLGLLVLSEQPLSADAVAQSLQVSRGNVSMAAKELQSWQLIRVHREPGDRKDYYCVNGSIWEMAQQVMKERTKREINPTLSLLRNQLLQMENDEAQYSEHAARQLKEVHDLLELFTLWFADVQSMKQEHLRALMKMGSGVGRVLELRDKLTPGRSGRGN